MSKKRTIEKVYLDITEQLNKILEKYEEEDIVLDEFIIEILEYIRDTLEINHDRSNISIMVFNEELMYDNVLYTTFYDLYKKLNPKVKITQKFVKRMNILKKNLDPVKKGNRCLTCQFPFIYVINIQICKVCVVCRRLKMLKEYYIEHNDILIEELYINTMEEIKNIKKSKKNQRKRDILIKKLKLITENL